MRRRIRVPGVRDTVSGFLAFRLSTLRDVFRERAPVLIGAGWAANAELIGRAAARPDGWMWYPRRAVRSPAAADTSSLARRRELWRAASA
jgi:hypothetical protein